MVLTTSIALEVGGESRVDGKGGLDGDDEVAGKVCDPCDWTKLADDLDDNCDPVLALLLASALAKSLPRLLRLYAFMEGPSIHDSQERKRKRHKIVAREIRVTKA